MTDFNWKWNHNKVVDKAKYKGLTVVHEATSGAMRSTKHLYYVEGEDGVVAKNEKELKEIVDNILFSRHLLYD